MFPQNVYGLQLHFIVDVKMTKQKGMQRTSMDWLGVRRGQLPGLPAGPRSGAIQSPRWSWMAETSVVTARHHSPDTSSTAPSAALALPQEWLPRPLYNKPPPVGSLSPTVCPQGAHV